MARKGKMRKLAMMQKISSSGITQSNSSAKELQQAIALRDELNDALEVISRAFTVLGTAAGCTNGRETQKMIAIAKDTLMAGMSRWDTATKKLIQTRHNVQSEVLDAVVTQGKAYYDAAAAFLVNPVSSNQRKLRAVMERYNTGLKPVFDEIGKLTKGGRHPAERALLGKLALNFEIRERKFWKVGEEIYLQLVAADDKILGNDHRLLKSWLKSYMLEGTTSVNPLKRTELGKIVGQEVKKARQLANKG